MYCIKQRILENNKIDKLKRFTDTVTRYNSSRKHLVKHEWTGCFTGGGVINVFSMCKWMSKCDRQ